MYSYDEPVYLISVVSKILKIHPQTLRQYEREGLILPSRTDGRMRLYSQKDIDKIKMVLRLTRDLGVNLAGVDIILKLKDNINELEKEVDDMQNKLIKNNTTGTIPLNKSIVTQKNSYEIMIFEES